MAGKAEESSAARIEKYLREFATVADGWFVKRDFVVKRYEFYKRFFAPDNLRTIDWPQIQQLGDNIHALSTNALAKKKAFGRPNYDIGRYRATFERLARSDESVESRMRWFLTSEEATKKYLGESSATEILAQLTADTHVTCNRRDLDAAAFLGITILDADDAAARFERFSEAVRPIFAQYEKLVGKRTAAPIGLEVDQFFSWVYEAKIPKDEPKPKVTAADENEITAGHESVGAAAQFHLNTILCGPPGTGKTYLAMRMALAICDRKPIDLNTSDRDTAARFEQLQNDKRVAFTTFHQSTSYEDFVEGLRPDSQDGTLVYQIKAGCFKEICAAATLPDSEDEVEAIEGRPIWKMSLGSTVDEADVGIFSESIAQNVIALGYGKGLDFTGCDSRDAVLTKLREKDPNTGSNDFNVISINTFKNRIGIGDIVVVSKGNRKFRAIGKVTGDYRPPRKAKPDHGTEGVEFWQTRAVQWFWHDAGDGRPYTEINTKVFSQASVYQMSDDTIDRDAIREIIGRKAKATENPHVIIIDEINRGNVARILGELITLIEPRRRLGNEEATKVQLTYSQKRFGVPRNLYIIGTMNTADRSIAFLDSALRRRFQFESVLPKSEVVRQHVGQVEGIEVASVMDAINRRVAVLLGEEHQIGHSYFLEVKSLEKLRDVLVKQVIPLLREHFHGDDGRWCVALGCHFDPESGEQANADPVLEVDPVDLGDSQGVRPRIRINPIFAQAEGEALRPYFTGLMR